MKEDERRSSCSCSCSGSGGGGGGGDESTSASTSTESASSSSSSKTTSVGDGTETEAADADRIQNNRNLGGEEQECSANSSTLTVTNNDDDDEDVVPSQPKPQFATFPLQLMDLIEKESTDDNAVTFDGQKVVEWISSGEKFIIRNTCLMESSVLPKYFNNKSKFMSFVRKLYR